MVIKKNDYHWVTRYDGDVHAFYIYDMQSGADHCDEDGKTIYYRTRLEANTIRTKLNAS